MADFFKGLSGGLQTGLQFGQAMRERQQREALAQAYGLTPQEQQAAVATPEQLARAQAEQQALQQQDARDFGLTPEESQRYAPAAPVAGQRVAMPTYGLGGQTFDRAPTQQQIDAARSRAAADVYGQYGDAANRERILAGLRQEERAMTAEQRAAAQEARSAAGFTTQQTVAQLQIDAATRKAQEEKDIVAARRQLATLRKAGPLTAAAIQQVAEQSGLDPTKFLQAEDVTNTLEIKDLKRNLSSAALKGEAGLNQFLADKFDPDKTDNIKPVITKGKDGNFVVTYGDRVLDEYGAHKNMMSLVGGVINIIDDNPFATLKTLSELDKNAAAIANDQARTDIARQNATNQKAYYDAVLKSKDATAEEKTAAAAALAENRRFESLTKSDAWQLAERKGDAAAMRKLLVGRGINPAIAGMTGAAGWGDKDKPAPTPTPTPTPARGLFTAPGGETQLLQPLFDIGDYRRRLQQQSTESGL